LDEKDRHGLLHLKRELGISQASGTAASLRRRGEDGESSKIQSRDAASLLYSAFLAVPPTLGVVISVIAVLFASTAQNISITLW
jgi:hypothetical protein